MAPKKKNSDVNEAFSDDILEEMLNKVDSMFDVSEYDQKIITGGTGLDILDALCAVDKENKGMVLRTLNTAYGNSGGGKTTLLMQISAHIVKNSEAGKLFVIDCEKTMNLKRLQALGVNTEPTKFKYLAKKTTIENFFSLIQLLSDIREKQKNLHGEKYIMENPYIIVVDSFSAMPSNREVTADADYNQAMGTSARAYSALFKLYIEKLFIYNITVFGIMQKRDKISIMGQKSQKIYNI
jgi:RecA/RadA recombinase